MKTLIPILICLVLSCSCGPQRRLVRLLERHPELRMADTITIRDTIALAGAQADTSVRLSLIRDSVVVEKERLQVVIRNVGDTLYIRGKCKPDTVIIRHQIAVEKIRFVKPSVAAELVHKIPWIVVGIMVFAALVVFLLLRR